MSSPIGEPPVRRHLAAGASALLAQAARGARERALRQRALLGPGRETEVGPDMAQVSPLRTDPHPTIPWNSAQAHPTVPWNSAQAHPTVPWNSAQAHPAIPWNGPHPHPTIPWHSAEVAVKEPPPRPHPTIPWHSAGAAVKEPPPRPHPTVPWHSAEAITANPSAAAPTIPENRPRPLARLLMAAAQQAAKARTLQIEQHALSRPVFGGPSAEPGEPLLPAPAPFPPHPAAPGPHGSAPGPRPMAPSPAPPAAPESQLLAEERLREELARILRADGLRHGLDLKEG